MLLCKIWGLTFAILEFLLHPISDFSRNNMFYKSWKDNRCQYPNMDPPFFVTSAFLLHKKDKCLRESDADVGSSSL